MYKIDDYLRIRGIRGKLSQCFSHIYQRKRYVFCVVYVYSSIKMRDENEDENSVMMNSMLNLFMYACRGGQ